MTFRPFCVFAAMLSLSGCATALDPSSFAETGPEMRPEAFFRGVTTSTGVLENRGGAPTRLFEVQGMGTTTPDGGIRLEQRIVVDRDPPQSRVWELHRVDANHYAGTLSDAVGAVQGEAYGRLFHVHYAMQHPAGGRMEQWIYLQPDGRSVMNEATITIAGLVVARLSERITRSE